MLLIASCQKKASREPGGVDTLAASKAELAQTVEQLRALGVGGADDADEAGGASSSRETAADRRAKPSRRKSKDLSKKASGDEDGVAEEPKTPEPEMPPPPPPTAPKPASGDAGPVGTADGDDARCSRICELAGVACRLEQRICGLAEQHAGEREYDDACFYARDQCELASDACDDCGGSCSVVAR